jgi:hypothetical protein
MSAVTASGSGRRKRRMDYHIDIRQLGHYFFIFKQSNATRAGVVFAIPDQNIFCIPEPDSRCTGDSTGCTFLIAQSPAL